MNEFIVSARKYRPETFKSVVGQENITTTLKNAIAGSHLGHAYLFCGPRGVGKTTCARIFAKTINCQNLTSDTEPCNECESCKSFNEARSYNIHELDAASNNTVEDIRSLNEQVRIPPQIGKYSVYIIDEVHMLSQSAFNAFLKTLEEPPAHAVFILATTEKHKIIPTILSRCQIYDFNRIKVPDAVAYLEYIAKQENIEYEKEAFHVIAQKADGAMRDALSIFDQVVSFSGNSIAYQSVIENLNILDFEYYFRLSDCFLKGLVSESLLIFDEILDKGFDAHNFINGLASHLRELLVALDPQTIKLLEVSDDMKQKYLDQAKLFQPGQLFELLEVCSQIDIQYKTSRNTRLLIELGLVKMSNILTEKKKPEPEIKDIKEEKDASVSVTEEAVKAPEVKNGREESAGDSSEKIKRNLVRSNNISIKDALSPGADGIKVESEEKSSDEDTIESDQETMDNDFSRSDLIREWKAYVLKIKDEKPRLYNSLLSREPGLGEHFSVLVEFDNQAQMESFNLTVKPYLKNHLMRELKNTEIEIICTLAEKEEQGKKLYTEQEKFDFLSKKNPDLIKMKQQFNLDFD